MSRAAEKRQNVHFLSQQVFCFLQFLFFSQEVDFTYLIRGIQRELSCKVFRNYSRVWNKRTPLNKRSPLENLAKRIIVAQFLPYTMKSGIRP